jgi:hypothetical protein
MLALTSTAKFAVFNRSSQELEATVLNISLPLPSLDDFTSSALKEYRKYVPDDMDWDIYEACAISVKEQRQMNPDNKDGVPVLTYGEINFDCLAKVLYDLKMNHHLPEGTAI